MTSGIVDPLQALLKKQEELLAKSHFGRSVLGLPSMIPKLTDEAQAQLPDTPLTNLCAAVLCKTTNAVMAAAEAANSAETAEQRYFDEVKLEIESECSPEANLTLEQCLDDSEAPEFFSPCRSPPEAMEVDYPNGPITSGPLEWFEPEPTAVSVPAFDDELEIKFSPMSLKENQSPEAPEVLDSDSDDDPHPHNYSQESVKRKVGRPKLTDYEKAIRAEWRMSIFAKPTPTPKPKNAGKPKLKKLKLEAKLEAKSKTPTKSAKSAPKTAPEAMGTPAKKKRGRPPLSDAEKARRAAEKAAKPPRGRQQPNVASSAVQQTSEDSEAVPDAPGPSAFAAVAPEASNPKYYPNPAKISRFVDGILTDEWESALQLIRIPYDDCTNEQIAMREAALQLEYRRHVSTLCGIFEECGIERNAETVINCVDNVRKVEAEAALMGRTAKYVRVDKKLVLIAKSMLKATFFKDGEIVFSSTTFSDSYEPEEA